MIIDLNQSFPESATGTRGPLPKQRDFLNLALDPKGPKYISYIGGIGSGKTLIGCIAMVSTAIQHPGDYLICRQFMPQLKDTTLKTFLEVCPPGLIAEYRVAESVVKLKAVDGKFSYIYFRQLEEPEKLRSFNLSGFLIDEGNQVSEEAFMLLQGRLRGKGLRKGLLVSNPNGHDWIYRWFFKKDHFKTDIAKQQFHLIRAPSTENIHLPPEYVENMMQSWSQDRIDREINGSFDAFEGMVYHEFRRDTHVIKPFKIPDNWPRFVGIDHGYRNPSAWVWCAVGPDGEVYVYREFYEREWLIEEIVNGKRIYGTYNPGVMQLSRGEKLVQAVIDPSTKARRGTTGESDYDEYVRCLPHSFPLYKANNDVELGINRVKGYLKPHHKTGKPRLFVFETCTNLLEEITQYRYQELRPNQEGKKAEKEQPYKNNDHALDALRYVVMLMPDPFKEADEDIYKKIKYNSLEGALHRDLEQLRKPRPKDPFNS